MTLGQQLEEALDLARTGDYVKLDRLVLRMVYSKRSALDWGEVDEVRNDVLLALARDLQNGTPTPRVAFKVGRIVMNKINSALRKRFRRVDGLDFEDPEERMVTLLSPFDVHAEFETGERLDEAIRVLKQLQAENPRYLEAIKAKHHGVPVHEYLAQEGNAVKPATGRKILERAHEKANRIKGGDNNDE